MYQIIDMIFTFFYLVLIARTLLSWIPHNPYHPIVTFIYTATDPILKPFQNIIPPIGGTLDISPILAFIALELIKKLIFSII
jgi:YggT family protein